MIRARFSAMLYTALGILAVFALLAVLTIAKRKLDAADAAGAKGARNTEDAPWPFDVRHLLTAPERTLYHRLVEALPDHLVFAQVGVSRVLHARQGPDQTSWHNRIAQLSFDFVVCSKDTLPVLLIELDDRSHGRAANQKRDQKKDRAARDAGIRLVRWNVADLPDRDTIRSALPATASSPRPDAAAPA